ncbi:tRNA (guanosine(37)-N1)-methyltransferase TrmD [Candidatus Nomurabacteria bacterium RIFCSPLOWO2_01_FULL_36_10b]|uniref:tRNA (guanine-N(1)-)-methyltransferase n=1 Tax=Candidatus Nomurabacteria bacterium RIFCSPLOWO2_01_FULL_36_10b TaxID=1801766 RepID=A0A1F6WQH6_9BACT|nr:MAG: tRNA (guanosine(37)-N1)-methyltransferase TrmD [Candidatus Nomurabacteria bacterium RIFCSPLOWO2_01_FULL_36_10b]
MIFHIVTLFPDIMQSYFSDSVIGVAVRNKKIQIKFYNPRDYTTDKHHKADDRPYGGGPGMVMYAEPVLKAVAKARGKSQKKKFKIIILSPGGNYFTNTRAREYEKKYTDIILICGRYEGIDARVEKILKAELISIGDYVVTGGELPAMIIVDAIARQIKGVLGKYESLEEERISSHEVYTRPEVLIWKGKKHRTPDVLLSGNHKDIENWKKSL